MYARVRTKQTLSIHLASDAQYVCSLPSFQEMTPNETSVNEWFQ